MITPLDIQNKNFKKSFMGFNKNEVNFFLQEMIEDYEEMYKENINHKEKINFLSEQLNQFKTLEDTLKSTLLVAQKSADELTLNARNKADIIIDNAENKGKEIIDKSKDDVKHIKDEYEFMEKELFIFKTRFSSFLQSQITSLDDFYLNMGKERLTDNNLLHEE
jgi:cell division initiation protein